MEYYFSVWKKKKNWYGWVTGEGEEKIIFAEDAEGQYEALYMAAHAFIEKLPETVTGTFFSSNEVFVSQVNGEWAVKSQQLVPLCKALRRELRKRPKLEVAWISKKDMAHARV